PASAIPPLAQRRAASTARACDARRVGGGSRCSCCVGSTRRSASDYVEFGQKSEEGSEFRNAKGEWARLLLPLFWLCAPAKVGSFGRAELPPRAASTPSAAAPSSGGVPS